MYKSLKIPYLIQTLLVLVLCSCVKGPSGDSDAEKLSNFDWKTSKTVPIKVASKDGLKTKIYIYNGAQVVASGYTPFNEQIEVPLHCKELMVSLVPPSELASPLRSATSAPEKSLTITCGDAATVDPSVRYFHEIYMSQLYILWEANYKNFGWEYYVSWWNTPGGPQGQSTMTLHLDRPPVQENGELKIYHTCKVPECQGYQVDDVPQTQYTEQGTYLFEDLFPSMGDYDMNDFVLEKTAVNTVSQTNKITNTELTLKIMAVGGSSKIALGCYLPGVSASDVEKIEMFTVNQNGDKQPYNCTNASGMFNINTQGIEVSSGGELVIPVFDNAMLVLDKPDHSSFFNTTKGGLTGTPVEIKVNIAFKSSSNISISDFKTDIFIMPRPANTADFAQRANEIHMVDAKPTSLMDQSLFGKYDDASKPAQLKYFRAKDGYVWGLYIPVTNFRHPLEKVHLSRAYPEFKQWVESNGAQAQKWYENPSEGNVWSW